jgi:hypothetical protein
MKTMTPKEKATELTNKYFKGSDLLYHDLSWIQAKECALIAVEEILNNNCGSHTDGANATNDDIYCDEYFWNDVKSELQSL